MEPERRFPLLGQGTPGLPRVPVKLDGPFGGFGERGDAASARVAAVADRPAVVQRLPARLGKRDLGIGSEPDRGEPPLDPDALPPCLADESKLPSAGSDCAMAASYVGEDDEGNATYAAGIRAGLDVAPPTIQFSPASPKADASSLKEFQVQVADAGTSSTGRSGLHSTPVLSKVVARDADNDMLCGDDDDVHDGGVDGGGEESVSGECKLAGGIGFNDPLATTDHLVGEADTLVAYYTFTAVAQDKAGNKSEEIVRTAVHDDGDPVVGLIVGGYDKGAWSLTATLTDNLSLKAYWPKVIDELNIDGTSATRVLILPREGGVGVDEYNSPEFTQSYLTMPPITMHTYRAMQAAGPDAAPATIDTIQVVSVRTMVENPEERSR